MRALVIVALLSGCGGDDDSGGGERYDCDVAAKTVTMRRGTCYLAFDPASPFGDGCPLVMDVYCTPDGLPQNCPSGWGISCTIDPVTGNMVDCSYGSHSGCTMIDADTVSFDSIQTLNGIDGLSVLVDGSMAPAQCEFRPCNPL